MAADLNYSLADELLDAFIADFPAGSKLQIRSGAPAGAENAAGGVLLVEITLPASPWGTSGSGSVDKAGVWSDVGLADGTAAHFRLKNAGDTKRLEGTVTLAGGGGDLILDNTSIATGQVVTIATFTLNHP